MAFDKAVDSVALESGLTTIADAIRAKGGTAEPLEFPQGMADAVAAISGGGEQAESGTFTLDADGGRVTIPIKTPKMAVIIEADIPYAPPIPGWTTFRIYKFIGMKDGNAMLRVDYTGKSMDSKAGFARLGSQYVTFSDSEIKLELTNNYASGGFVAGVTYKWEAW